MADVGSCDALREWLVVELQIRQKNVSLETMI